MGIEEHRLSETTQGPIWLGGMLLCMQESITDSPVHGVSDFAGLLAALAAAKPAKAPVWSEDELLQDVATLSYERALQTHARYRPSNDEFAAQLSYVPDSVRCGEAAGNRSQSCARGDRVPESNAPITPSIGRDRKCASVTIRMSQAECEQLRRRATEAGLTISAYLRSCTFEADALRAQVKDALAELRGANSPIGLNAHQAGTRAAKANRNEIGNSRLGWLRRLVPDLHPGRITSRA
jgi:Mobilization protein NikA